MFIREILARQGLEEQNRLCGAGITLTGTGEKELVGRWVSEIEAEGAPELVVDRYIGAAWDETRRRTPWNAPTLLTPAGAELRVNENRFGSFEVQIDSVHIFNAKGIQINPIASSAPLTLEIKFQSSQLVDSAMIHVKIRHEDGLDCFATHMLVEG